MHGQSGVIALLENESGILQPPTDGEGQSETAFEYSGPLSRFHSFKELLLLAADSPPDNCYSFFDLMTGSEDRELREGLVAKTRSIDPRTAYFALSALAKDGDPDASKLAKEALERSKNALSPELQQSLEYLIQNTERFAKQPPL